MATYVDSDMSLYTVRQIFGQLYNYNEPLFSDHILMDAEVPDEEKSSKLPKLLKIKTKTTMDFKNQRHHQKLMVSVKLF